MKNETLHDALMRFPLEQTGGSFSFLHRLCRENGWSRDFGRAAIREYKRFLYLASVSPTPVTPSQEVDQVWHLHLVYTRSYWQDLCGETLGRQLHHGPTKGGDEEDEKFTGWYNDTKALYEAEFGAAPPADLWPSTERRFQSPLHLRWLDTSRNWIIPKPTWPTTVFPSFVPLLALALPLPWFPLLLAAGFLLIATILSSGARRKGAAGTGDEGGDCSFDVDGGSSDCGDSGGDCGGGGCSSGCGGGGCGGGGD